MYRTVIVPLDGSPGAESAVPTAAAFARRAGATVELVTVAGAGGADARYLEKLAGGVTAEVGGTFVLPGRDAAAAITARAWSQPDPVICMTTHARSPASEILLGSVAEAVVRDSGLPVLLVGPKLRPDPVPVFDLMLVCLDGTPVSEAILPVAAEWHRTIGTRPWLLQVLDPALMHVRDRGIGGDVIETGYLRRTAARLQDDDITADFEVVHERRPGPAIARFADRLPASVVAVATHGRGRVGRAVLGSVAVDVVHRVHCPVLVVCAEA